MDKKRVVVTGIGTVNPLGKNVAETWEKAKNGKSGIGAITKFDAANFTSQVAGEVKDFDYKRLFNESQLEKTLGDETFC